MTGKGGRTKKLLSIVHTLHVSIISCYATFFVIVTFVNHTAQSKLIRLCGNVNSVVLESAACKGCMNDCCCWLGASLAFKCHVGMHTLALLRLMVGNLVTLLFRLTYLT